MRHRILLAALITLFGFATFAKADDATPAPSRFPLQATASNGASVTVFQPQLDNFQGDELSAHAAVAVQMPGQSQPTYGAVWLQTQVSTDRTARTVEIVQVTIPRTLFPGFPKPYSRR
jgi:hypothetical protein